MRSLAQAVRRMGYEPLLCRRDVLAVRVAIPVGGVPDDALLADLGPPSPFNSPLGFAISERTFRQAYLDQSASGR